MGRCQVPESIFGTLNLERRSNTRVTLWHVQSPLLGAVSYTQLGILLFYMGIILSLSFPRSKKFSLKSACYVSQITAI
jgi:hypothetical protein